MPILHVHLREGFTGERVVIAADDRVLLDEADVRTRPQVGAARLLEHEVPARALVLRVDLPDRGATRSLRVDPARTPVVEVSVTPDGTLSMTPADAPRGYR